jgi:hypothetical protein
VPEVIWAFCKTYDFCCFDNEPEISSHNINIINLFFGIN